MAKGTQTATKNPPKKGEEVRVGKGDVAKLKTGSVAAPELLEMMGGDAGKGVSTDMSDNIVPLLYILQANSPALDRQNTEKYLGKDAKAGDLWMRGTKTFAGADPDEDEEGAVGVPCHHSKCWIEWRPDRGGFVGRHKTRPAAAVEKMERKEGSDVERPVWRMPNGNSVQETREYVFMVTEFGGKALPKPKALVIPMTSTNHTPGREWMSMINEQTVPGTDKAAPIYAFKYRILTKHRSDGENGWYVYSIVGAAEDEGSTTPELLTDIGLYRECRRISERFATGEMQAEAPHDEETEVAAETGDEDGM